MEVIIAVTPEWGKHDHDVINWHAPSSAAEREAGGPSSKAPLPPNKFMWKNL